MRRGLLAVLALVAAAPAASAQAQDAAPRPLLSGADRASFTKLEKQLGGSLGLAVTPAGRGGTVETAGSLRGGVAWSTSKTAIAMAVVARGQTGTADLRAAITASDNAAAERLWSSLGTPAQAAAAADEQLAAAGDITTRFESRRLRGAGYTAFGQTAWTLADQATFTAGMRCTAPGRATLKLMGQVVAGQRWGLGSVGRSAQFKGGWGPGSLPGRAGGYLDRQMGVLRLGGRSLAVTIAGKPADGSHETGTQNLTAVAKWLVAHADARALPVTPSC